jgi:hypothetical protein
MHTLQALQLFGLDPACEAARRGIPLVAAHGRWEHAGQRYFDGEVEPCINGRTIEAGAYFGVDVAAIVERILGERLADGGWNCEAENGSVRSSFDDDQRAQQAARVRARDRGFPPRCAEARRSGRSICSARPVPPQEHGRGRQSRVSRLRVPVLLALRRAARARYFRRPGAPDPRMAEAVEVVRSSGSPTAAGSSTASSGRVHFDLEGGVGRQSLEHPPRSRVLDCWWDRAARGGDVTPQPRRLAPRSARVASRVGPVLLCAGVAPRDLRCPPLGISATRRLSRGSRDPPGSRAAQATPASRGSTHRRE